MIKQAGTIAVYVDDQQASLKFWTERAGFAEVANHPMGPDASWIEVAPPGAQTRLVLYPKAIMPGWEEQKAAVVFECDDIQETYKTLSAKGVRFLEAPNQMPWGTYARFEDIDGNEFLLKQ
ncbi:VOC family protein [Paenibacillus chitinolyticus]|uniref:VOC family protein n=1 Tax=Paenibacillus chitinolyticus TaxID=79263 RepID=UPI003556257D